MKFPHQLDVIPLDLVDEALQFAMIGIHTQVKPHMKLLI